MNASGLSRRHSIVSRGRGISSKRNIEGWPSRAGVLFLPWILFMLASLTGCAVGTAAGPKEPTSVSGEVRSGRVAFSLTRGTERDIALAIPLGWRHASYDWDRVPYRESYVQVLRSCNYYTDVLHVPPVTRDRWWCWDTRQRTLTQFTDADEFEVVVKTHPNWIWLIANEPDLVGQDELSPEQYAEFFGHVAAIVAKNLKSSDPDTVARLVFCQVSQPGQKNYCERAYVALKALLARRHWPEWPESVKPADVVHAISVHNYVVTYDTCDSDDSRCYGSSLEENHLRHSTQQWARAMGEFSRWAKHLDGGSLADKPLWLTEFGALAAFCPRRLEMRPGVDRIGGVGCPHAADRTNGRREDDFVFYGRNEREGLWGVQRATLAYLLNPTGDADGSRPKWVAAWWFSTRVDWSSAGECSATSWLFGHDVDCNRHLDTVSRAGETYRDTIHCLARLARCPEEFTAAPDSK